MHDAMSQLERLHDTTGVDFTTDEKFRQSFRNRLLNLDSFARGLPKRVLPIRQEYFELASQDEAEGKSAGGLENSGGRSSP